MKKYLTLMICLTLMGCNNLKLIPPISVSSAINNAIKIDKKEKIILREYTNFEWKKVYIFGPYTTAENVNAILGFNWVDYKKFGLEASDSFDLIVFILDDKVARVEEHSRSKGDFQEETLEKIYTPNNAIFKVKKENNWYKIYEN